MFVTRLTHPLDKELQKEIDCIRRSINNRFGLASSTALDIIFKKGKDKPDLVYYQPLRMRIEVGEDWKPLKKFPNRQRC